MGQYYLTVNVDKRQYLDPHKFGSGLKLMEFSGVEDALPQALCVLLAHSNGRGGGDLHVVDIDYNTSTPDKLVEIDKGVSKEDAALVGSWAGDRIVVAGDYDDPWLFVPEDLKMKPYQEKRYKDGKYGAGDPRNGTYMADRIFGMRNNPDTGKPEECDQDLYDAARIFFEDISDRIMKVIALAESPYHGFAAVDLADDGWRHIPRNGCLPCDHSGNLITPKKPLAGKEAWKEYEKHAKPYQHTLVNDLAWFIKRHADQKDELLTMLQAEIDKGE